MKILFLILFSAFSNCTLLFSQNMACAYDSGSLVIDGENYYFDDSLGQRRTPVFKIDACDNFMDIDADICYMEPHKDFAIQIDGKWGCMDMFGTISLPVIYDQIVKENYNDRVFVRKNKDWFEIKYKFTEGDFKYKEIKLDCDYVSRSYLGCVIFVKGDKGYFSKNIGHLSESYDEEFYDTYYSIKNGCQYGVMTITGRVISPAIYDRVTVSDNLIAVYMGNKCGLFNPIKGLVSKIKYDDIGDNPHNDLVDYTLEGKEGLIGLDGKEITAAIYDDIYFWGDSLIMAKRDGKWGFLNGNGKEVIEMTYEKVAGFKNGLAGAKKNGKWGFINVKNEVVIDFQFDQMSMGYYFREPNKARARLGDECFYINQKGERLEDISCK